MQKRKIAIVTMLFIVLMLSTLWSNKCELQIEITGGFSTIYSEFSPVKYSSNNSEFYYAFNYGILLKKDKHLLDFNVKYFEKNPDILTTEISNEITGKEFWDFSLKYGRWLYSYANFDLNAYAGIGFIIREVNREKAGPPSSTKDEFVTFPLKLTLSRAIYKNIGMNVSIFSDLNFEETIGGLEINLQLRIK